jgi:hypothetical protein
MLWGLSMWVMVISNVCIHIDNDSHKDDTCILAKTRFLCLEVTLTGWFLRSDSLDNNQLSSGLHQVSETERKFVGLQVLTAVVVKNSVFWNIKLLATCFTIVSCLAYSCALKMEASCSFEKSVNFEWTSRHYNPESRNHQKKSSRTLRLGGGCGSGDDTIMVISDNIGRAKHTQIQL